MPKTYYDSELTAEQIETALTAIDGVVIPGNNGKVLYIENGQIKAASASRWSGAVLEPLSVTANGDYTPPTGTDGFDSVHVAVPSATLTTKSITQNGTYNASSDNADGYSSVTVNVSGGGSAVVQPLSVTQNGTYTPPSGVDGYAPVTVNVSGGSDVLLQHIDSIGFNNAYLVLPFMLDEKYQYYMDFSIPVYKNNMSLFGSEYGNGYDAQHLTQYNNGYDTFATPYHLDVPTTGRHTVIYNNANGELIFDNTVVAATSNLITANYQIQIGKRKNVANLFTGTFHRFSLTDNTDGNLQCDLVPFKVVHSSGTIVCFGLHDIINDAFYVKPDSGTFVL